jgi:hypothetical protein
MKNVWLKNDEHINRICRNLRWIWTEWEAWTHGVIVEWCKRLWFEKLVKEEQEREQKRGKNQNCKE